MHIVREGAGELHQQRVERPEAVTGHRVHQALEVLITVPIEANFFRFLLGGERLQCACAVEATVRAVSGTGHEPVTPRAGVRTAAAPR